jgi:CDP-glycerol glycerophosphotransferase
LSLDEKLVYNRFLVGTESLDDSDLAVIKHIFERESRRVLGSAHFDIAIEFGGYAPYWCAFIAAANADRRVIYQHNHLWAEYQNPDPARNQNQLYGVFQTYRWFDAVVAVSEETRLINETFLAQFYRPDVTSQTVRNTINIAYIKARATEPFDDLDPKIIQIFQDPTVKKFLALGRLSPEKRYDRMIQAFAKATSDRPNAKLLICGRGPLQNDLFKLTVRLKMTDRVLFLGQIHNPYPLLAAADYLVMSSDYEGQPMALLEGLCLGTSCIGTDIAGIASVLKGRQGHLVAPAVDALADALRAAIEGTLPPLPPGSFDQTYVTETMESFYALTCGISPK